MLLIVLLVAVGLTALLFYKGPVKNNVGLADPATWHVEPTRPVAPDAPAIAPVPPVVDDHASAPPS